MDEHFQELASNPNVPPEVALALRAKFGLDDPIALRYLRWLVAWETAGGGAGFAAIQGAAPHRRIRRRDRGRAVGDESASRNRKFESTPLHRRVSELSVPDS